MKLQELEDKEREQREAQTSRKKRKGQWGDLEFWDSGGNVYILTVGAVVRAGTGVEGVGGSRVGPEPTQELGFCPFFSRER